MQRVSTAFVGQVSAASSPAVAKLKGRARAINNSAYVPLASSHRAPSRRADEVIESKSTRLTREHRAPRAPRSTIFLRSVRIHLGVYTDPCACTGIYVVPTMKLRSSAVRRVFVARS